MSVISAAAHAACTDWPWLCWIEAHPGLAAWLQALGGVGAIGAAVVLAFMQSAEVRRQRRAEEQSLLVHAYDLSAMIAAAAQSALNSLESEERRKNLAVHGYGGQASQQCREAVRAFPGERLRHVEAARWLRMALATLVQCDELMVLIARTLKAGLPMDTSQYEGVRDRAASAQELMVQIKELADNPWGRA